MNNLQISIRAAAPDDAEVLAALEAACFSAPWSKATIEAVLSDEKYVVLLAQDQEIFGYALAWSIGEEAECARLGVLSTQRGRGAGEQLLRATLKVLKERGARDFFLEVREDNKAARRLYARCGFEEIAVEFRQLDTRDPDGQRIDVNSGHVGAQTGGLHQGGGAAHEGVADYLVGKRRSPIGAESFPELLGGAPGR